MSINDEEVIPAYRAQNPATLEPTFRRAQLRDVRPGDIYWCEPWHEVEPSGDNGFSDAVRLIGLADGAALALADYSVDERLCRENGVDEDELTYFDTIVTILSPKANRKGALN